MILAIIRGGGIGGVPFVPRAKMHRASTRFREESLRKSLSFGSFSWGGNNRTVDISVSGESGSVLKSSEVNCRCATPLFFPPLSLSLWNTPSLSASCYSAYICLGTLTGNPCHEPLSCHTRFDSLTWCCKHSFYFGFLWVFWCPVWSVANWKHITNQFSLVLSSFLVWHLVLLLYFFFFF